jgi:predicted aconitase with swiveling domain
MKLGGRGLTDGEATGELVLLEAPLSLWGGLDPKTGRLADPAHPGFGRQLAGRLLAMPEARGSSSSSSLMVEAVRRGTAPAALLLLVPDPILVIATLVAADLYGVEVPIVCLAPAAWARLEDGARLAVSSRGGRAVIRG